MDVKSVLKTRCILQTSGTPEARSMATSLALHVVVMGVLMLIPAQVLLRSEPPNKELDLVFYRPPEIAVRPRTVGEVREVAEERRPHRRRLAVADDDPHADDHLADRLA